ncbi:MAG: histidine phosphatase family protein [Candidatus Nanopelagicales bacterium]
MGKGRIILVRHGETAWSLSGQHTGRSDIPLTEAGESRAAALRPRFAGALPDIILCSPMSRAQRTAELAGLWPVQVDEDLLEWDYGAWEGRTTADIRVDVGDPDWTIWSAPIPAGATPGEQAEDVAMRAQRVLHRCAPVVDEGGTCALVAHGHFLRILTATWLGLPARDGRLFVLEAGAVSALGHEREQRAMLAWNT